MQKSRELEFDYGVDLGPQHLYSSWGQGIGNLSSYDPELCTLSALTALRFEKMGEAYTAYPDLDLPGINGYEKFSSSTRKPPYFNNCNHVKSTGCSYPVTWAYKDYRANVSRHPFRRFAVNTRDSDNQVLDLTSHHVVDLSSARSTAWGTMQPRFEGTTSMFNFIIELKDFKSLARFLMNKPIRKLRNMFYRIMRNKRKHLDLTKPLAEAHLANEFALKPLIADIINISVQMEQLLSENQQNFADAGRDRNTRHYTELFPVSENTTWSTYYQARYPERYIGQSEQLTFTASMEYSYEYNMRSTLDAFVKYWGLAPTVEGIWNALPGSFIVDYFLKVGDALAINSRDKNVLLTNHQYCESLLSERSSGTHLRNSHLVGPLLGIGSSAVYPKANGNNLVTGARSTFYTRAVTEPRKWTVLPRFHKPTTKQGWNLLALTRCFF